MEIIRISWGYERKWVWWFAIPIASIFIKDYYLQYINFLSLSDKESVIVSPVITAHTLRKKEKIKTVSVLTRLPSSLVPCYSLNWLNGWSRENIFGGDSRSLRNGVLFVLAWVAWVAWLCGFRTSVGGVRGVLTWVTP